jgi:flagellar basal-body rod modification protein FlgD
MVTTTVTPVTTAAASASVASQDAAKISTDYTTFLKMMTTQLQNQDPMNPTDSSAFAVQLATFSGVEQQVKTNELLANLGSQFGVLGMAQLAGWVGQEARSAAPVYQDGTPVTISYAADPLADRAVLVATDANGNTVGQEDVPLQSTAYQWLGANLAGNPLPSGSYSLRLESYREGQPISTQGKVGSYQPILEARGGSGGSTTLILRGGVEVASTEVTALRVP